MIGPYVSVVEAALRLQGSMPPQWRALPGWEVAVHPATYEDVLADPAARWLNGLRLRPTLVGLPFVEDRDLEPEQVQLRLVYGTMDARRMRLVDR